jgi:dipeptide/tripeptide permease
MSGMPDNSSDLSKGSLFAQLGSFGAVYWFANWIELVERFAYYGLRAGLPVFMVAAVEKGGPELTQIQKGNILAVWAVVQSFVPILSGGFADRYGFKVNIALSSVLTSTGYLIMGYSLVMAEWLCGMPLREARSLGTDHVYEFFFVGAMFVAFGTAIFKPGVQGLVAAKMPTHAASLGWSVFYQSVNIGGFLGPLVAGYFDLCDWQYVFVMCAGGVLLNLLPLLLFREPARRARADRPGPARLLYDAVRGLLEPRLFFFTISFAGFWLMFYQLFDILPNFIDDWVDSRGVAAFLASLFGANRIAIAEGGNLAQAWIINFDALLIAFFAFAVGFVTGRMRSLVAIIIGIAISAAAIYALGMSMSGWWTLGAIGLFALGEMMASPTKMRYLAGIAPPGKEGQYMGYVNFTVGIGWSIGSIVAGHHYEHHGDKVNLARRFLVEHQHLAQSTVDAVSKNDLMAFFEKTVGVDAWQARQLLWDTYDPQSMWLLFTLIGAASMLAIVVYNYVVTAAAANPTHSFNTHGDRWVCGFLAPICLVFLAVTWFQPSIGLALNTGFFLLMLAVLFVSMGSNDTRVARP